jgi:hypothetical protein
MTEAEQMARRINDVMPDILSGSLSFWGNIFGGRVDNIHWLVGCEAHGDLLSLRFNEDELLSVWSPRNLVADKYTFRIFDAVQVRWEWFSYGGPKTPENLFFEEFKKSGDAITAKTNATWYQLSFTSNANRPAVEILR